MPRVIQNLKQTPLYKWAHMALKHARPRISSFVVGAAGYTIGPDNRQRIVTGWNNESRSGDSIHSEESLVAKVAGTELLTNIMILGQNGSVLSPCGNCRDVLITNSAKDAEIVMPSDKGDDLVVLVRDLLPGDYSYRDTITSFTDNDSELSLFNEALRLMNDRPYNPYTGGLTATALITQSGSIFAATPRENAAYHRDFSVELALGMADSARDRAIAQVLFIFDGTRLTGPQFPCGRSLQKLYEASEINGIDFEVISASTSGQLWFSMISELYPHPFGPKNLGIDVSRYL